MKQLVLASNNPGKIREIRAILAPLDIEVVPQSHYGVPEADEPHGTFIENALAKARHAAALTGCLRWPTIPESAWTRWMARRACTPRASRANPNPMSATTSACSSCSRTPTTEARTTTA